jgi:hypothetical protein
MNIPHLENWALIPTPHTQYTAPELIGMQLTGDVKGHSRHDDGRFITTSRVIGRSENGVHTRNTVYTLGKPHPDYEAQFPGAASRFMASLPIINTKEIPV